MPIWPFSMGDDVRAAYARFNELLQNQVLTPEEPGYLITMTFINDFKKAAAEGDRTPNPIHNNHLIAKKKLKPGLTPNKECIVVTYEIWNYIQGLYKGGPELTVPIIDGGEPEFYPLILNVRYETNTRDMPVSKKIEMSRLYDMVHSAFSISPGTPVKLVKQTDHSKEFPMEGTVATTIKNDRKILVLVDSDSAKGEVKTVEVKETGKGKHKKAKKAGKKGCKYNKPEKQMVSQAPIIDHTKPVGLPNYGNTCYLNSSLQSLMCIPSLVENLDNIVDGCKDSDEVCATLRAFYQNRDPRLVKKAVSARIPIFKGKDQQDAHEFVTFFIDMLHDESPDVLKSLFYGQINCVTRCASCNESVTRTENFSTLSLSIDAVRRITYIPYDMKEQIQKLADIPEDEKCINIGVFKGQLEYTEHDSHKYEEVLSLQKPASIRNNHALILLRMEVPKKKKVLPPLLMEVPLEQNRNIEKLVWDRVKSLWRSDFEVDFELIVPQKFEIDEDFPDMCKGKIVMRIADTAFRKGSGFRDRSATVQECDLSLEDLINSFFRESQLDSHNQWKCEKCNESTCAYKKIKVVTLPRNLILHLKRFTGEYGSERDDSRIEIPQELVLMENGQEKNYALVSITNHSGTTDWGHYTAVGRLGKQWYLFNDSKVSHASPPKGSSEAAYLLFYTLRSGETPEEEEANE